MLIFIIPYHIIGGAERVHINIIKTLRSKPIVIFPNLCDVDSCKEFDEIAYCVKINSVRRRKFTIIALNILSTMFKIKIFGCNTAYFYEVVAKLKNKSHNIDLTHSFIYDDAGMEIMSLPVVNYLDKRIVINQKTYSDYKKLYQKHFINSDLLSKFKIIENGVEIQNFNNEWLKSRFQNFTIGYVGRNSAEKRPELFLELSSDVPCVNAIVIGDDFSNFKYSFPLVSYYEGNSNPETIRELFKNISLLIVPSLHEGFPLVIMEAMELGIPVIATDVGSIFQHVINGKNGFLAEVDAVEFKKFAASKIIDISNNHQLYSYLAVNARKHAEENFSIMRFFDNYKQVFYG